MLIWLFEYADGSTRFDIARQHVDKALIKFAPQAGIWVLFSCDKARHRGGDRLENRFTVNADLVRLLAGTGLVGKVGASGVLLIITTEGSEEGKKR